MGGENAYLLGIAQDGLSPIAVAGKGGLVGQKVETKGRANQGGIGNVNVALDKGIHLLKGGKILQGNRVWIGAESFHGFGGVRQDQGAPTAKGHHVGDTGNGKRIKKGFDSLD